MNAVTTRSLGDIERFIGRAEDVLIGDRRCTAQADRDGQVTARRFKAHAGSEQAQALCRLDSLPELGPRQEHGELLASKASQQIRRPKRSGKCVGEAPTILLRIVASR